jgi:predicted MFS family arabinose efflux permease
VLLLLIAAASPLSFATWHALINNFAVEQAGFNSGDMGILQSVREIPGFLAFTAILLLLLIREQRFAFIALIALGLGTAATGFLPSFWGLMLTTIVMSAGFHYFETINQSLALQWLDKRKAPAFLGKVVAVMSLAGLVAYGLIWLTDTTMGLPFWVIYLVAGGVTTAVAVFCWFAFPLFKEKTPQHKKLLMRKRYWLYYALVFMSGARRQIFVVFASFLLVQKFDYTLGDISLLLLINGAITIFLAPLVGKLIGRYGERRALILEYIGLIGVFAAYAFVEDAFVAAILYVIDHLFFAMAIAIKTYFQKIADPADIAATSGVSFSINHVAAVVIPVIFGFLYLISPAIVFLAGSAMAAVSLALALNVPLRPMPGNEVLIGHKGVAAGAAVAAE